jgi:Polyketide cyclase / dehydrase and lipid transport
MDGNSLYVEREVEADAERIFALLADAANHPGLDGSGTIRGAQETGAQPLTMGSEFVMKLTYEGTDYTTLSRVIVFDPGHSIAWQTRPEGEAGKIIGGRIWRYDLTPSPSGTIVRETWDITEEEQRDFMKTTDIPAAVELSMQQSLARLAALAES